MVYFRDAPTTLFNVTLRFSLKPSKPQTSICLFGISFKPRYLIPWKQSFDPFI